MIQEREPSFWLVAAIAQVRLLLVPGREQQGFFVGVVGRADGAVAVEHGRGAQGKLNILSFGEQIGCARHY